MINIRKWWQKHEASHPLQTFMHAEWSDVSFFLYLRWRDGDPWQLYVCVDAGGAPGLLTSDDLFLENGIFFKQSELSAAQNMAFQLVSNWIITNWRQVKDGYSDD